MRIYAIDLKSYGFTPMIEAFKKLGNTVTTASYSMSDSRCDTKFEKYFDEKINDSYDMVFTFNYFPIISICCNKYNIKYVSWVYDSPHVNLFSYTVINPCNYIFIFDKELCMEFMNSGITTVHYLPLAANPKNIASDSRYKCDASFVGSLYDEPKHQLFKKFDPVSDYTKGYLDAMIEAQLRVYGYFMLKELLTKEIVDDLQKAVPYTPNSDGVETDTYVYSNYFIARRVTEIERKRLIDYVSNICDFKLFTHSHNPVDYYNDMPKVFASSKINLNITLKSIKSGIPLRAFDIMSANGFLLTNFQLDFMDFFVPGEDFVYYDNLDDAVKKVQYYLTHDSEREQIATNGFMKIKEYHTFEHRVKEILNTL